MIMTSSSKWVSTLAVAALWAAPPAPASAQVCSDPALQRQSASTSAQVCSDPTLQSVDVDEDGVCDLDDAFPNDPCESMDANKNGVGDNADMLWAEQQERFLSIATRRKSAKATADAPSTCVDLIEPLFSFLGQGQSETPVVYARSLGIQCDGDTSTCSDQWTEGGAIGQPQPPPLYNYEVCCNCGGGNDITTSTCGSTCDAFEDYIFPSILYGETGAPTGPDDHEGKCAVVRRMIENKTYGCLSTCTPDELNAIVTNAKATHAAGPAGIPETWYTNESYACAIAGYAGALNTADLSMLITRA